MMNNMFFSLPTTWRSGSCCTRRTGCTVRRAAVWLLPLLMASVAGAQEGGDAVLEIHGTQVRAVVVAVPPPVAGESAPASAWLRAYDERLRAAVGFHGALAPLDRAAELVATDMVGSFDPQPWRSAGAEILLQTRLHGRSPGVEAEVYMFDVGTRESLLARRFRLREGEATDLADAVGGAVVEALLGVPSLFDKRIAFQYREPDSRWRELAMVDWQGRHLRRLSEGQRLILTPAWVPRRGGLLAVGYRTRSPGLFWFDVAGGRELPVVRGNTTMHGVAPLPDGNRAIFAWERNRNTDLYLVDLTDGKIERLTTSTAADLAPTVSPDGQRVIFVSDRRGNPYLFELDLETRRERVLLTEGTYLASPQFSPDGTRIVYLRRDRGVPFTVWTHDLTSGQSARVTPEADDSIESPIWAPDGRTILYTRQSGGSYDLWKVDRLLKRSVPLTRLPGDARMPSWER